jgi:hypothetical protein
MRDEALVWQVIYTPRQRRLLLLILYDEKVEMELPSFGKMCPIVLRIVSKSPQLKWRPEQTDITEYTIQMART